MSHPVLAEGQPGEDETASGILEPRYGSDSLADLLPSVCDGMRVPGAWDILGLGECERVAVVVIDGLGWHQVHRHATTAPVIAAAAQRWITTVTPSTTATALTSLGTGLPAGQHGVVGASFWLPDSDVVLYPLTWRKDVSPASVAPQTTWWTRADRAGVAVSIVSPRPYAASGLTAAALSGGRYRGGDGPGERVAEIAAAVREGDRSLVYGYWEALDRTAHIHGVGSPHYRAELAAADRFVAELVAVLPTGSRLIVTADHGVVDCHRAVDLDASEGLRSGVRLVAGEPRLRHAYVQRGWADRVAQQWKDELAGSADVMQREDFIDCGYLGPMEPEFADRLGDVIALATGSTKLTAPSRDSTVSSLIGQHGSLTPAEMAVPLAVWDL